MQSIVAWVRDDFGIELTELERDRRGADEGAAVWRGTAADGRAYAVKWSAGGTPAGLLVPALLASAGARGIAAPVRTRAGDLWSERDGRRLSLVPWISDEHSFDSDMNEARWRSYGAVLAAAHATKVEADLPRETYDHQRWTRAALELDAFEGDERIRAIVEQVDALGGELAGEDVEFVLCHTDPHRGNVLLTGDQAWLIDWDDVMLAPRERDLMFPLSNVAFFGPSTDEERAWFFAGYGPVAIDERRVAYHQAVRTLEDLVNWSQQALDPDGPDRARAVQIVRDLFAAGGLATSTLTRLAATGRIPH